MSEILFASDEVSILKFKQVSDETNFCGIHSFSNAISAMHTSDVAVMLYVSCIHDDHWWTRIVNEVSSIKVTFKINFLHPSSPSPTFCWLVHEDECWAPSAHICVKFHISAQLLLEFMLLT